MKQGYENLLEAMVAQAINESLCGRPDQSLDITMESIANARKWIQSDDFELAYSMAFGVLPGELVPMLRKMWVDVCGSPQLSKKYREIFSPQIRREYRTESPVMNHPRNWYYTRSFGAYERWNDEARSE